MTSASLQAAASPVAELSGVSKVFKTGPLETVALAEIELVVQPREYVCVEGPSGCGKSTLLAILGLLESPTAGQCRLSGMPLARLSARELARLRNRHIGFIFQSFNLIGDMTIEDNVALPLAYMGIGSAERRRRARQTLARVGLEHRGSHRPPELSGGQQQRAAVARALVTEPSLLLADEPTGNLDSHNGEQVMTLFRELHQQGSTIVMVTHDPRFVREAGRVIHLFDGRIVKESLNPVVGPEAHS
jgi:putative ABC transport system ATP-binding protein